MLGVYPDGMGSTASGQQLSVGFGPEAPDYSQVAVAAGGAWGKRVEKVDELHSVLQEAVRFMRKANPPGVGGRIIQITSGVALGGYPACGFYCASKHGQY